MELTRKEELLGGYLFSWRIKEIKTEEDCLKLVYKLAGIGDLLRITFRGYEDMDEHGNEVSFKTLDEYAKGVKTLEKIDPDTAFINLRIGGEKIKLIVNIVSQSEDGIGIGAVTSEELASKVSKAVEKIVTENWGK